MDSSVDSVHSSVELGNVRRNSGQAGARFSQISGREESNSAQNDFLFSHSSDDDEQTALASELTANQERAMVVPAEATIVPMEPRKLPSMRRLKTVGKMEHGETGDIARPGITSDVQTSPRFGEAFDMQSSRISGAIGTAADKSEPKTPVESLGDPTSNETENQKRIRDLLKYQALWEDGCGNRVTSPRYICIVFASLLLSLPLVYAAALIWPVRVRFSRMNPWWLSVTLLGLMILISVAMMTVVSAVQCRIGYLRTSLLCNLMILTLELLSIVSVFISSDSFSVKSLIPDVLRKAVIYGFLFTSAVSRLILVSALMRNIREIKTHLKVLSQGMVPDVCVFF